MCRKKSIQLKKRKREHSVNVDHENERKICPFERARRKKASILPSANCAGNSSNTTSTTTKANTTVQSEGVSGKLVPQKAYQRVEKCTIALYNALQVYCHANKLNSTEEAFNTLAVEYNLYTAPGMRGKNKSKLRGIILHMDHFIKAIKNLLAKRSHRIQAQYPLAGKSVLAFPTQTCNQALWTALCHPEKGLPEYHDVSVTKEKGPWGFPHLTSLKEKAKLKVFNRTIKKIHKAYTKMKCSSSKSGACSSSTENIEMWVQKNYRYLERHESWFGLHAKFHKTKFYVPYVPEGRLLIWNGYHQTTDKPMDENGVPQSISKGLLKTLIVDAAPKSMLPERAWQFLHQINKVCITDIGEGAEWSRHGQHWIEYAKSKKMLPGLPLNQMEQWMKRFFDPKAKRVFDEEPSVQDLLSLEDCESFRANGFRVSSSSFAESGYPNIANDVKKSIDVHRDFAQFVLFGRDNIKTKDGNRIELSNKLYERLLLTPQKVSNDLTGYGDKLYLKDCKHCSRFPKAPKAGLGPAASCYGIPSYLRFQCYCALALEKLYGEECMVIPERIRIKAGTKWGFLHSDQRLLPCDDEMIANNS
eukprot:g9976.t1